MDVTDVNLCTQILAKFVTLREDGNQRPRWEILYPDMSVTLGRKPENGRLCHIYNIITAWADCVAYLEGRQCEKPAYGIGKKWNPHVVFLYLILTY